MKPLLLISFIFCSFFAQAETEVKTETEIKPQVLEVKRYPAEVFSEDTRYEKNQIHIFGLFGYATYKLDGSTSFISTPKSQSYGVDTSWNLTDFWKMDLNYESRTADIHTPDAYTPADVAVKNDKAKIAFSTKALHLGNPDKSLLGIGYFYNKRTAARSTPLDMVSDTTKSGLMITYDYIQELGQTWHYKFSAEVGFVSRFKEDSATSGAFESGYIIDTKLIFMYPISEHIDLAFGAFVQYDTASFNGTGTRGISEVKETTMYYGIPIEIVWFF